MDDLRTNTEKILANVRKEQITLFKQTADRYILLSNMESFLTSIIDMSDNIHPNQDNFILVDFDTIMEQCLREDTANILVDDNSGQQVCICATDGSRNDTHSKPSAAISVAYNRNSHLNLATPSKFFASTEILEIEAIILALKQSTKNNIKRLHITVDNLSALHFATQTATLTRETSTYLQEKIEYNHYYEESYTEIKNLISNFSHLSTSHTKAHTNSLSTLSQLNCLADRLARSCQTGFSRMIKRADIEDLPLTDPSRPANSTAN